MKNLSRFPIRALLSAGILSLAVSGPALAGNVWVTGHDDDFHRSVAASAAMNGALSFVRSGAPSPTLPVLSFDHGSELTTFLTGLGVPYVNIDPNAGVPAASNFDVTKYSAMVVASDTSCGGCDNNGTSSANLAADSGPIASFFNSGGGIIGLAGASNTSYYDFLPSSAANPGVVFNSFGFTTTAYGTALGIPAVNGDFPHNFFAFPGTDGMSALWKATETYTGDSSAGSLTDQPFSLAIAGATIGGGGFHHGVPEPSTLLLLGSGLTGLAMFRKRLRLK